MTRQRIPPAANPSRDQPRILDRHAQVLGIAASPPGLGEDVLAVEVTETLHRLLNLDEGRIEVPRAWVAGIRRDQVRLSVAIEDPAFRARVLDQPRRREPLSPAGQPRRGAARDSRRERARDVHRRRREQLTEGQA